MGRVIGLRCVSCGRIYSPDEVEYVCPRCGPIRGTLEVLYDYDDLKKNLKVADIERGPLSQWRYLPLLPVSGSRGLPRLRVGWTPLYRSKNLEKDFDFGELWLKDDGLNPSGSLKDRASQVAVAHALEKGRDIMVAASTGNAASSLAVNAAPEGIRTVILVPEGAPRAKLAQLLVFGAEVYQVRGTYDDAYDLSIELALRKGWYLRSTAYNPYLGEGKKTVALELAEQLRWKAPDWVVIPVGDGCIFQSVWKGFKDLHMIGFIDSLPRLIGVQAEGCSPLKKAFFEGKETVEVRPVSTIADSIMVANPRDQVKALKAARESRGTFISVSDQEILNAIRTVARKEGIFSEPAAASVIAALPSVRELVSDGDRVVLLLTGNGLKDIDSAMKSADREPVTVSDLDELLGKIGG